MSLVRPCSICGEKKRGKDANVTTAWWTQAGNRVAWRQYMCIGCFAQYIVPLEVGTDDRDLTCPLCHIDAREDMDPVYYTLFVPGTGEIRLELSTDPACAALLRARAEMGGVRLEDRGIVGLGSRPNDDVTSAWDELGLGRRQAS